MDKRLNKELEVCFCRYHLCSNCSNNPLIFVSLFPSAQVDSIIRHAIIGSNTYYAVVIGETWEEEIVHWRRASKVREEIKAMYWLKLAEKYRDLGQLFDLRLELSYSFEKFEEKTKYDELLGEEIHSIILNNARAFMEQNESSEPEEDNINEVVDEETVNENIINEEVVDNVTISDNENNDEIFNEDDENEQIIDIDDFEIEESMDSGLHSNSYEIEYELVD